MQKRKKTEPRDARLGAGERRLAELGVDPQTAPISDLENVANEEAIVTVAVAAALGERPSHESALALRRLEETAVARRDKVARREARRSLYKMERRGIEVPPEASPVKPKPSIVVDEPEGWLSVTDPSGSRLLWILAPRPGGGLHHLTVVVNEPEGLRDAVLAEVTRKIVRSLRQEMNARHGLRLVDVDWRYVDGVATEGFERASTRGARFQNPYPTLRMRALRKPTVPVPPPIESVLTADDVQADPVWLDTSATLFDEEELRGYALAESFASPFLDRFREIRERRIVTNPSYQKEAEGQIQEEIVSELSVGLDGAAWERRLAELAYYLSKTDRIDAAKRGYAVALAIRRKRNGEALEIPFLNELVRRTFGLGEPPEPEEAESRAEGSLIVTPDELRSARATAPRRRMPPTRR